MGGSGRYYVLLLYMYLLVRLFFAFYWAMQMAFSFCLMRFFVLHLVVGYAKPCWRDGDARISNAAACQYGRIDRLLFLLCVQ